LKHEALKLIVAHAVGTRAGATLNIDDAMPRNAAAIGKCVEGVANEAGVTGNTREERDLAVGGDATARDAPNDGVDEGVREGRGRQGSVRAMPNVWHQRRAQRDGMRRPVSRRSLKISCREDGLEAQKGDRP
jgi:hypothetical protein